MSPETAFDFLCKSLETAVIHVFSEQALTLRFVERRDKHTLVGDSVFATIGFAGNTLRGALAIATSDELLRAILREVVTDPDLLADFLGEVANMTAGHVKVALLRRSVVTMISTPTCASGPAIRLQPPSNGTSAWLEFSSDSGPVFVRLEAVMEPSFELGEEEQVSLAPYVQSETLFF